VCSDTHCRLAPPGQQAAPYAWGEVFEQHLCVASRIGRLFLSTSRGTDVLQAARVTPPILT